MSPLTSPHNFRYPALSDTPNVPRDIQALAVDIGAYIDVHPGPQGTQGTTGIQGLIGTQGIQGRQGTTGSQGTTGIQGTTGLQGFNGFQGIQGFIGSQGTTGTQGVQGNQGTNGTQGVQGLQGGGFNQLQGVQGVQGQAGSVQGTQGIQGGLGSSILGLANTFTSSNTFTPSTSVDAVTINQASSSKGLIVKANATTPGNLTEWQNSSGTPLLSVSSSGVLNATGTTNIGPILTFANPGVGQDTRFNFTKTSDTAWLSVFERSADSTYYEFGMGDNPTGGDYFQWKFDNYEAPAQGWMPIQIGAMATRFTSAVSNWGSYSIPSNTSFATLNSSATSSVDFQVNKYSPTNSTTQALNKDSGSGTGTVTLNAQSYTGTGRLGYWISIDAGGTAFSWGNGYVLNTAVATGVTITGSAQTLNNGVTVTLSLSGHVAGDKWSFLCFPRPTVGIGGSPLLTSMHTVYPAASTVGIIVRGATSQSSNLQEWQNSSSTNVASISASGAINAAGFFASGDSSLAAIYGNYLAIGAGYSFISGTVAYILPSNASTIGLVVQGRSSQTADLQQWKNNAGTILAKVTAEGVFNAPLVTNAQTASYTAVLADADKLVEMSNASANNFTVPLNSSVAYAVGTQINILQTGAGQTTVVATGGVTINATPGLKLRAQWSSATLIKRATDTWVLVGDLSA
jgi:hypothetical protein